MFERWGILGNSQATEFQLSADGGHSVGLGLYNLQAPRLQIDDNAVEPRLFELRTKLDTHTHCIERFTFNIVCAWLMAFRYTLKAHRVR